MGFLIFVLLTTFSFGQEKTKKPEAAEYNKKLSEGVDTSNRRELSDEELMQKFFNKDASAVKKKNKDSEKISLPVFYESMSRPLTQIQAKGTSTIRGIENLEVDGNAMLEILKVIVDPAWMERMSEISARCPPKSNLEKTDRKDSSEKADKTIEEVKYCWVPIEKFADPDVLVTFNDKFLEIRIKVKPEIRSVKVASLTRSSTYEGEITNEPSWFSSYFNFNFNETIQSDNTIYQNGREPLKAQIDSATRFGPVLLEANAKLVEQTSVNSSSNPPFTRENVRAILDFPSIGSRAQIGDLTYPVGSFQNFRQMAGLSFFTQSSLKSSNLTLPSVNYDLNLARPSKVSIFINDKLIQIIDLPAGRHNVRDFPFVSGQNDLKLEIRDDMGRVETMNYSILLSNGLLKYGEHEVSYSAGMPSTNDSGNRNYDSSNLTLSFYHKYGMTQGLTLGAGLQSDHYQTIGTLAFNFVNSLGFFVVEPALSLNQDKPAGEALNFRYIVQDLYQKEVVNNSTTYEINYLSSDFAQLGTRSPTNQNVMKFQVNHSKKLSKKANLNASLSYSINRQIAGITTADESYSFSLGARYQFTSDLSSNFSLRNSRGVSGQDDISINFFLLWSMSKEKQYVTLASGSGGSSNSSRADWTTYSNGGTGSYRGKLNIQNKDVGPGYGGEIEYSANRATMYASHQITLNKGDSSTTPPTPKTSVHSTNLLLGTAVVFAGGKFSISRPIYDSFVMFSPLKNLNGKHIQINPEKDGSFISQTDWLGAAVASETPSYHYSNFNLVQEDSATGVALPKDHFSVKPLYKSGYNIIIGTDATIYLQTKLVDTEGNPVSMIAAKALYLDNPDVEPVNVFTNRTGLIRSEGFRHGRYKLEIDAEEYGFESVEFTIPDDAPDEFQLPVIKVKAKSK